MTNKKGEFLHYPLLKHDFRKHLLTSTSTKRCHELQLCTRLHLQRCGRSRHTNKKVPSSQCQGRCQGDFSKGTWLGIQDLMKWWGSWKKKGFLPPFDGLKLGGHLLMDEFVENAVVVRPALRTIIEKRVFLLQIFTNFKKYYCVQCKNH